MQISSIRPVPKSRDLTTVWFLFLYFGFGVSWVGCKLVDRPRPGSGDWKGELGKLLRQPSNSADGPVWLFLEQRQHVERRMQCCYILWESEEQAAQRGEVLLVNGGCCACSTSCHILKGRRHKYPHVTKPLPCWPLHIIEFNKLTMWIPVIAIVKCDRIPIPMQSNTN